MTSIVTARMREQYETDGYFILERALSEGQLELLRSCAAYAIQKADREMDAAGVDRLGLDARGKRYFSEMIYRDRPELRHVLFGDTMAQICRAALGEQAYLFWEQYVIKGTDPVNSSFAWHQDSGYVHENHAPYLTVWIALDDVDEENGSVYLLPYTRSGIRSYVRHVRDEVTGDRVCYFGADPGLPVVVPAGSLVCFSSVVIHRSGPNTTRRLRRAYLAQYSGEVIRTADGGRPWGSFEQFLEDGRRIVDS